MTRRSKIKLLIVGCLLVAGAAAIAVVELYPWSFAMETTDPAWADSFRQARLRRGADEQLFDLSGKFVARADYPAGRAVETDGIKRQLIVELPGDDTLRMNGTCLVFSTRMRHQPIGAGYLVEAVRRADGWRVVYDLSIPPTFNRQLTPFSIRSKVRQVDLVVTYWRGPMGKAPMTFIGPFEKGKAIVAREVSNTKLTVDSIMNDYLRIEAEKYFNWGNGDVNGYDAKGHRYEGGLLHGSAEVYPGEFLEFHGVKIADLVAVTCGEIPYKVVLKNVPLDLPASP